MEDSGASPLLGDVLVALQGFPVLTTNFSHESREEHNSDAGSFCVSGVINIFPYCPPSLLH